VKDETKFEEEDRKQDIKIPIKHEETNHQSNPNPNPQTNTSPQPHTRTPPSSSSPTIKNEPRNENELIVIKEEPQDYSDFESGTGSEYEEGSEDSEDEMPIAKLRKVAVGEVRERGRVGCGFGVLQGKMIDGRKDGGLEKGAYKSPYLRVVGPASPPDVGTETIKAGVEKEKEKVRDAGEERDGIVPVPSTPPQTPPTNVGKGSEEVVVLASKPVDISAPNPVTPEVGHGEKQKRPFEGWSDNMKFGSWSKKRKGDDDVEVLSTGFAGGVKMERS